jgi:gluconokinase
VDADLMRLSLIVMGVSGAGKSVVAADLARRLQWELAEGDSLHPAANVAKMSAGTPLTDEDRWPWLRLVGDWIDDAAARGVGSVVTCSALKRSYRDLLCGGRPQVRFVHLAGSKALIGGRLGARRGHFMPPALLDSQLGDLEPLGPDEPGIVIPVDGTPAQITDRIMDWLATAESVRPDPVR